MNAQEIIKSLGDIAGRFDISDEEATRIACTVNSESEFIETWENDDWWTDRERAQAILEGIDHELRAWDVNGDDHESIATYVMQGVIDNDHVNNGGEVSVWNDASDAMDVYTDNGPDIEWNAGAIDSAEVLVALMMKKNGNLK